MVLESQCASSQSSHVRSELAKTPEKQGFCDGYSLDLTDGSGPEQQVDEIACKSSFENLGKLRNPSQGVFVKRSSRPEILSRLVNPKSTITCG